MVTFKVGDRVEVPNEDAEGFADAMIGGVVLDATNGYLTIKLDDGTISPYAWVEDDGVILEGS